MDRFLFYNMVVENNERGITNSNVINFTVRNDNDKEYSISGRPKGFAPECYYLGSYDYESHFQKIKIKADKYNKLNEVIRLTSDEEVALMLNALCTNINIRKKH